MSYEQLDGENEVDGAALRLLTCAACLAPGEPVPIPLLRTAAGLADDADALLTADGVKRLVNLGLLEAGGDGALHLHRLLAHFATGANPDLWIQAQEVVEQTLLAAGRRFLRAVLNRQQRHRPGPAALAQRCRTPPPRR